MNILNQIANAERTYQSGQLHEALVSFKVLVTLCPIENKKAISKIFFNMGNIWMELGNEGKAIDNWKSGLKLSPAFLVKKKVLNGINDYGMKKNRSASEDDFKAFSSFQISKYLHTKVNQRFGNLAESDMVLELVIEGWQAIISELNLNHLNCQQKVNLFNQYEIDFPYHCNYQADIMVKMGQQFCHCGSGLPHFACCGAIKEPSELINGL